MVVAAGGNTLSRQRVNGCVRGLLRIRCCTPLVHLMKSLMLPLPSQINLGAHAARGTRCTQNNSTLSQRHNNQPLTSQYAPRGQRNMHTAPPLKPQLLNHQSFTRAPAWIETSVQHPLAGENKRRTLNNRENHSAPTETGD